MIPIHGPRIRQDRAEDRTEDRTEDFLTPLIRLLMIHKACVPVLVIQIFLAGKLVNQR